MRIDRLPYPLRVLGANVLGYKKVWGRYGPYYREMVRLLERTESLSRGAQEEWQCQEFHSILDSAATGTEHYRGVRYDPALPLHELLKSLPVLTKKELKADPARFFNQNVRTWARSSTSGTTGSPLTVEHSLRATQRRYAITRDHFQRAGIGHRTPSVRLSGRIICDPSKQAAKPWIHLLASNQLLVSTYHLDARHARTITRKLESFNPQLLDGYASGIHELLRVTEAEGLRLSSVKAVVTTAETLDEQVRTEIERLASAPILDYYSASEGTPMIQQCTQGTYHVRWQTGLYEVMVEGEIKAEGDGELVATSLTQDRTPLIRYQTGDHVQELRRAGDSPCACGLLTPTIARPEGRLEDLVVTRDGRRIGMFAYRTLKHVEGLKLAQVHQEGLERFSVLAVLEDGVDRRQVAGQIQERFEHALGYPIEFSLTDADEIPRGANGKFRSVVSQVRPRSGRGAARG